MLKREGMKLAIIFLFSILVIGGVFAQEQTEPTPVIDSSQSEETGEVDTAPDLESSPSDETNIDDSEQVLETEDKEITEDLDKEESLEEDDSDIDVDEELGGAGITPDSAFYFLDRWFDGFGDCVDNRKEKVAELREMVKAGKLEEAKESLKKYEECAKEVEKEVSPDEREDVQRGSRVIRKAIREIEGEIPSDDRKQFTDVIDKENKIEAAAEIASKIKELCEQLANLDPSEYERVCRVKGEAPKWQRDLDTKLTGEQKVEVREFVGIMSECFENPAECRCDDIKIKPFADKCSIIAPLAAQCELEKNEDACAEMEEIEREGDPFELLPDYLREAVEGLEDEYDEGRVGNFMPPECREAGATNPKDCMKIMFEKHAPEECQEALEKGEISFENERDARMKCEEIMFKANAPEECIEAGLKDAKECGKLSFQKNAPEECIEAGLTGENRNDHKKCEEIMRGQMGEGGERRGPGGPAFGARCKEVTDSEERLKCFDSVLEGVGDYNGEFQGRAEGIRDYDRSGYQQYYNRNSDARTKETMEKERACVERCAGDGKAWSFSGGACVCFEGPDQGREDMYREEFRPPQGDFRPPQCAPGQRWNCLDGQCKCEGEPSEFREGDQQPVTESSEPYPTEPPVTESGTTTTSESGSSGESTSGSSESGVTSGSGTGETSGSGETSGTTGSVIGIDNEFYDYYYN
ncbi:MAG: hypothetical protein Q7S27_01730 [Nanoarchaeota archaeon]|nr:hypothetical protein [Nanoarchaeota archaeon]